MENQYKERGIYKVRQDGTKDLVPFKTREEKLDEEKKRARFLRNEDYRDAWILRNEEKWDGWYQDCRRICMEMRQAGYNHPSILLFNDEYRLWGTKLCSEEGCSETRLHCQDIPGM